MDLSKLSVKDIVNNNMVQSTDINNDNLHNLSDKWTLWAHLPHDTDWSLKSYNKIVDINSVEAALTLFENFPDVMMKNCMLFLMREGVNPIWEDERNKYGGCFSYKVNNKYVDICLKSLSYALLGETIFKNLENTNIVTGISISPKKNFCVIKIWLENCSITDPNIIIDIEGLESEGSIFKKHII